MSRWAVILALGVAGCGKSAITVDPATLSAEGKADSLAAAVKYRDRRVHVRGIVVSKELVGSHRTSISAPTLGGSLDVQRASKPVGRVVLASHEGGPGHAVCYFKTEQLERVAPLQEGAQVEFACDFVRYNDGNPPSGRFGG